jgi:hypothetical protein
MDMLQTVLYWEPLRAWEHGLKEKPILCRWKEPRLTLRTHYNTGTNPYE